MNGPLIVDQKMIDKTSIIDKNCKIGKNVKIGQFCYIGEGVELSRLVKFFQMFCGKHKSR